MATTAFLQDFLDYAGTLDGDEKGESQVFLDRFFQAFGHAGYKEAGATLEDRIKKKEAKGVRFADLVWPGRVLIEMKKRGEPLQKHYDQARDYWFNLFPKPRYVLLCNFDEVWIYDFDRQHDPVDKVRIENLLDRRTAFNFMLPEPSEPLFNNNREAVTREAAEKVAKAFTGLVERGEDRTRAQHFVLQCVAAMFAEDTGLLPAGLFAGLVRDIHFKTGGANSYDLLGGLFRQMADPKPARGGRFEGVRYFNGGLFRDVDPVDLTTAEAFHLLEAASENWGQVQPEVFGVLFQSTLDPAHRHIAGAHFTHESDIQKIVQPTVSRPWRERIESAKTLGDLVALRDELLQFRVLDPACGSGNFLYVAFREMKRIEIELLGRIGEFSASRRRSLASAQRVSVRQMYGMDNNPFAVELAKLTLTLGKALAAREAAATADLDDDGTGTLFRDPATGLLSENALPLDDLDGNVICADALFTDWPAAEAVVGNPPFQSKNKMKGEFGAAYVERVRAAYPQVPGRADFCVYWIGKTHDHLAPGQRAGLVGTNTIRQNESREGGLDYVVANGGTITDAVSTQPWTGDAAVYVSVVNWIKGPDARPKRLVVVPENGGAPLVYAPETINAALSPNTDVTAARKLKTNAQSGACYQGQTHGHAGFLLTPDEAAEMNAKSPAASAVVHPYMTGDDLLSRIPPGPKRYAIDLNEATDVFDLRQYGAAYTHVKDHVLPTMQENAAKEKVATGREKGPRQNHLKTWWRYWRGRGELMTALTGIPRYVACPTVTKRPVFAFVSSLIHPNAQLQVFPLADDYSFGVLQSVLHWTWFTARGSTLKGDPRYTSDSVFDSFPWPQNATEAQARAVADAAIALRDLRNSLMARLSYSLRDLYRTLDEPGANPLRDAHDRLDATVRAAYGMLKGADVLAFLLALNETLAAQEAAGQPIVGPGLPESVTDPAQFITADAVGV